MVKFNILNKKLIYLFKNCVKHNIIIIVYNNNIISKIIY